MRYLVLCVLLLVMVFNSCSEPDPSATIEGNIYLFTDSVPPFTHYIPAVEARVYGFDNSVFTNFNGHYSFHFYNTPYDMVISMKDYGAPKLYNLPVKPGGTVSYKDIFLLHLPIGSYRLFKYDTNGYSSDSVVYFYGSYYKPSGSKLVSNTMVISFYETLSEVYNDTPNRQFAFEESINGNVNKLKFRRVDSLIAAGFHHGDSVYIMIQPAYVDSIYGRYKNKYIGDFYYLRSADYTPYKTFFIP